MTRIETDIVLGDRYRDPLTGLEGPATSLHFYLHGCERVALEFVKDGEIKTESFDAPRLVHIESGEQPTTDRTGGPGYVAPARSAPVRPGTVRPGGR